MQNFHLWLRIFTAQSNTNLNTDLFLQIHFDRKIGCKIGKSTAMDIDLAKFGWISLMLMHGVAPQNLRNVQIQIKEF